MTHYLHFTFGPVQSFVAQARRTRDLYAGSMLLSHLAMSAMRGIPNPQKAVVLPAFEELANIESNSKHASAPNRFTAKFASQEEAVEAASKAQADFLAAWRKIADTVWKNYLEGHSSLGCGTADIWERQVENFWQISWVITEGDEPNALDRRKNWQTYWPPEEPGDHCVLMGQWQELSGFIRSKQRSEQDEFWKAVQETVQSRVSDLELEDGERLCAIAFIKRFFPLVAEEAIGRKLEPHGWPSTVTMAALPWFRKIAATPASYQAASDYLSLVRYQPGALVTDIRRIKLLREFPAQLRDFVRLSGNFLNRTALANEDDTSLKNGTDRPALLSALASLEKAVQDRAGSFYAVLLMDGDLMGALIREYGPQKVTSGLSWFARRIPSGIYAHDGLTIYAGGDDLLALLPLDRALEAAIAARRLYSESFEQDEKATLSGAIIFAHYRCAFSQVLSSAHELLDDVAKDRTGRDSLAIRVLKPGGVTCEWSAPFAYLTKTEPQLFAPLVGEFGEEKGKTLTSSLLYNLRERFNEFASGGPEQSDRSAFRSQLVKLFTAEALIGKRGHDDDPSRVRKTEQVMEQLLDVCEVVRRDPSTKQRKYTGHYSLDGLRLIKFLALDGKEGAE